MPRAQGPFEVKLTPQPTTDADEASLGRMAIAKVFSGDLSGTSKGQMIAAATAVKGSAGYVAMERVTATLAGRRGSFVLQHSATMNRGAPEMNITVVPDSGDGELSGLSGRMVIVITDGQHAYDFSYELQG
jgi:hypothetical protein